ncbi:MAG: CDP-alcohol phosphatidyltransferase family protein [Bacteroidia bacterium]|nr:CDP-alcohol phosphatidyltransferase family protein [Bacteroidia bacterium]
MRPHIPNFLTGANLFFGMVALVFVFTGNVSGAAVAVGIALLLDFFDGFVARLLKVNNAVGKELDSLADVVTFGVVPGMVMARLIAGSQGLAFPPEDWGNSFPWFTAGFLVSVFSAVRLAKFNLDETQSDSFVGLPTPANTILIMSYWLIVSFRSESFFAQTLNHFGVWIGLSLLSSYLLVAKIRLLALKFKNFSLKDNLYRYLLMVSSVLLILIFQYPGIPIAIFLYFLLSVIYNRSSVS